MLAFCFTLKSGPSIIEERGLVGARMKLLAALLLRNTRHRLQRNIQEDCMGLRVALAADHGGFVLKASLIDWLEGQDYELLDLGAEIFKSADDYPDYAEKLAEAIISGAAERGILICGSGVGASIAANKVPGIRACLCHDTYSAHQGVEHDNMNVLCLGGRVVGIDLAKDLVCAFLKAQFNDDDKYRRRVDKIIAIETAQLRNARQDK